jgi:serine/threonine-protein kinase PpkA
MSMANPQSVRSPTKRVVEKWKRIRSLTAGGQGEIFLVKRNDYEQEEMFVQKRLKNANNSERQRRFQQETETTAKLQHPNILRIIESGVDQSPPYYISEYCEGGTLDSRAIEYRGDTSAVVRDLLPIVDALKTAHEAGVFHRDIKPPNILFRKDGTVVLGDFGICFVEGGQKVTLTDEAVGSINFIAPEMESGQQSLGEPSDRTDVYSLGKVIYFLLSGGRIFSREDHRSGSLSLVNMLKDQRFEHVHDLIDRMVVREPSKRIAMNEVGSAMEEMRSLVLGDYAPLKPSIGIRCRFCGLGSYKRLGTRRTYYQTTLPPDSFPEIGIQIPQGHRMGVLKCDKCGHIQMFSFPENERTGEWWSQ